MANIISVEIIASKIFEVRGKKVMLDSDLAKLYGVGAKVLNQAVKRNIKRFPEDFMLRLSWEEVKSLRSQIVTLNDTKSETSRRGRHIKYLPYAFTEQGIAMLSSVLNSERAIKVNIQIMRAFVQLRRMLLTHADFRRKIEEMEKKYDKQFGSFPNFVASFFCNIFIYLGLRQNFVHWAKFHFLGIFATDKVSNDQFYLYRI